MCDRSVTIGSLKLLLIQDGRFWLDGGAMFGVVPKVLWKKINAPDPENRIELALNCLCVVHPEGLVLIDTGLGDYLKKRFIDIYNVQRSHTFHEALTGQGVEPEQVRYVINTHLHFDHCGGNTISDNGYWRPAFPNARYIVQEREWEDANHPNDRSQASYLKNTFVPINTAGLLDLVSGDHEVLPGITVMSTNGHTRGHQSVLIESNGEYAFFPGDVIPMTAHIRIPYITGYDLYPVDLVETKKEILRRAADEHWLCVFEHDPVIPFSYIEKKGNKFVIASPVHPKTQ